MATVITPQEIHRDTPAGKTVTMAAADVAGNYYGNGTGLSLRVRNAGAGNVTMTVDIPGSLDGVAKADKAYTIPNDSAIYEFAPFPTDIYGQTVNISWSGVTSVTVAVIYLSPD